MARCPISMIISVYNNDGEKLTSCLNSILDQGSWDFEVILVNNGSTDESVVTLCEGYRERDQRVSVLHMEHDTNAVAYNKGLEAATGKYVHFIDPSDRLDDNAIEKLSPLLLQNSDVIFIDTSYYDVPNFWDISHTNVLRRLSQKIPDKLWDKLVRRDVLMQNDIHFTSGIWESVDFCMLVYIHAQVYGAVDFSYYIRHEEQEDTDFEGIFHRAILTLSKWTGPAESTYEDYNTVIHRWMATIYCDLLVPLFSRLPRNNRSVFIRMMDDFQWLLSLERKDRLTYALYSVFGPLGVSYLTRLFLMLILVKKCK